MEDSVKQRIKDLLISKSYTINSISKSIGIPQKTLNNQLNGNSSISISTILAICGYFEDVSLEWLLKGNGNMINDVSDTTQISHLKTSPVNNEFISFLRDQISDLKDIIESKDREINSLNQEIGRLKGILDENKIQYRQTGT